MTRTDDFIGQLERYLDEYEGRTPLPEAVRDAVRAELPTTRQRPPWWPARRLPPMNTTIRFAVATAAVVVAAILGYNYLIAPNVGGPQFLPTNPSPTPAEEAIDFTALPGEGTALEPGRYLIDYASPVIVTVSIPAETYETYPSAWYKALFDWGPWHQSNSARLAAVQAANLQADPCNPSQGELTPTVGPGIGELADAIEAIEWLDVTRSDTTLDGYAGELLEFGASEPPAGCAPEPLLLTTTHGDAMLIPGPGTRAWILDVGGERLMIWAFSDSEDMVDELDTLIPSIRIEAP